MTIERINIVYINGEEISYSFKNRIEAEKFLANAKKNPLAKDVKMIGNNK